MIDMNGLHLCFNWLMIQMFYRNVISVPMLIQLIIHIFISPSKDFYASLDYGAAYG